MRESTVPVLIVDDFNDTDGSGDFDTLANGNGRGGGLGGLLHLDGYGDGPGDGDGGYYLFGDGSANVQWSESVLCVL